MQNRSDVKSGVFLSSNRPSKVLFHSGKHMEAININFEEYKKQNLMKVYWQKN